ncbi:hypothetical protein [Liquorilactobacillus nagelii]|uniref:hypothetical protein n=1 Tax=Liquorilactobacillus nagelii TaxID=82688 RepID=UPI0039E8C2DA
MCHILKIVEGIAAGAKYFIAKVSPTIATWLADNWGIKSVGLYLGTMAIACFITLLTIIETKDVDFTK